MANGISGFAFVGVAGGSADINATGNGGGALNVLSGGVAGAGVSTFEVGNTNAKPTTMGTAIVTGDITGFAGIEIGNVRGTTSAGNATGQLILTGDLIGTDSGNLRVGRAEGIGNADGSLFVSGNVSGFTSVQLGSTGLNSVGDAAGSIQVGGMLSGSGGLSVGTVAGAGQSSGTLTVANGISGFAFVGVGGGSADINATGNGAGALNVFAGGVTGTGVSTFEVGNTNANPTTMGTAIVKGGITGFTGIEVGNVRGSGSAGNATGQLSVSGGPVEAATMRVGVSESGQGVATGVVYIDHSLVTLDTGLTLGNGSTLQLGIDGNNRGVDFAAFDVTDAVLDGVLNVLFSFDPLSAIYDLIISDSINGISGDFDSVSILGLGIGTTFSYGIEVANIAGMDVEVYRLRIGDAGGVTVPEPGVLVLLLAGLVGLSTMRFRNPSTLRTVSVTTPHPGRSRVPRRRRKGYS